MKNFTLGKSNGRFISAKLLFMLLLPAFVWAGKPGKEYVVLAEYDLPFLTEVTMPENWMTGFLANMGNRNEKLLKAESVNGLVTWKYSEHGLAPWMQFFYDWRG